MMFTIDGLLQNKIETFYIPNNYKNDYRSEKNIILLLKTSNVENVTLGIYSNSNDCYIQLQRFFSVLNENNNIVRLNIHIGIESDEKICQVIAESLASNVYLKSIEFRNEFLDSISAIVMCSLTSQMKQLKQLLFYNVYSSRISDFCLKKIATLLKTSRLKVFRLFFHDDATNRLAVEFLDIVCKNYSLIDCSINLLDFKNYIKFCKFSDRNRELQRVTSISVSLHPLDLPIYVILWITNYLQNDTYTHCEKRKIRLLRGVNASGNAILKIKESI